MSTLLPRVRIGRTSLAGNVSPVSTVSPHSRPDVREESDVGGDDAAELELHDVAGNELGDVDRP